MMETAKDYAREAARADPIGVEIDPPNTEHAHPRYDQARKLARFHLITAAKKLREIAEALAPPETK